MPKTIQPPHGNSTQAGKMGRPETEFDMETLIECCKIQCTQAETAAVLRVSVDTLERRLADMNTSWTELFAEYSGQGKMSLRRALHDSALGRRRNKDGKGFKSVDPNVTAQIWLSKQHLDMKDRNEVGFDPEKPAVFRMNMGKKLDGDKDDES